MTQEEYVQIIHNLYNSFKTYFDIRWQDGKGGKSQPILGFTATHRFNSIIHKIVNKDYVDHLQKQVPTNSYKSRKYNYSKQPVVTKVNAQQATLLRLKYGDALRYFEQTDGQVLIWWP